MKTIFNFTLFVLLCLVGQTVFAEAPKFTIDADFPGGNIIVRGIEGDTVKLRQDLRDTAGNWFYWSFRIRNAEEKTLNFEFTDGVIGARGPAVSRDGCLSWEWLGDKPGFSNKKFQFTFGPEDKEVYFGVGMNYTQRDLDRFLEKHKDHPNLKIGTLCKTKKGRNVELLRIDCATKKPRFKVYLSSRNHCCEMMATYALEGVMDAVLSDSDDGTWLRNNCDFFIVPLVDKDGVEDGDQGKNRKPHDHNRDYIRKIYPEVKAITEQVPVWQDGLPIFVMDMHCPWLRGGDDPTKIEKGTNEYVYYVGPESEYHWKSLQRFGAILEKERKGPIPYQEFFNLAYGKSWNKATNVGSGFLKCSTWGSTLPKSLFASSIELPYANASGVAVDAESARLFGNGIARSIRVFLETSNDQSCPKATGK